MKNNISILAITLCSILNAQEIVKTESGKKVKLNPNNTWEYVTDNTDTNDSKLTANDIKEFAGSISTDLLNLPIKMFKDGEENLVKVKVKFDAPIEKFNQTDFERINSMYEISMIWTKNKLKNPYSFSPKEISLSYSSTYDIWWCTVKYVAKNSYGGEVAGSSFFTYPMERVYKPYSDDELLELTSKKKKRK
ncbi:hypothetical protein M2347_000631 [Chryseobacterium sp. H1D6B]|uniref:DUF3157 family protein n=1 Tax=Chryseobacterium sp. H1D6B TaxID=2940588 RepID=UPI0015CEECC2|nr:DUF3157 family protein [Chryseobacterium sp. H1D6B]MDH6250904.1 hypothetical protein [Chryseobacterium sp. H1D6B]